MPLNEAQFFGVALAAIVAVWVIFDAMRRKIPSSNALLWGLGVFLLLIVFLPMYLVLRSQPLKAQAPSTPSLCQYCGLAIEGSPAYCPHCSKQLKGAVEIHGKLN